MPKTRGSGLLSSRPAASAAIGVLVAAVVLIAREARFFVSWELRAYDVALRATADEDSPSPVTMVWIREEEITEFGHPLPDRVLARALRALTASGPRAIGIDVFRDRPTPGDRAGWDELVAAFAANPNLVIVEKLADETTPSVPAPDFLQGSGQVGFADVVIDTDGVARRGLLYAWDESEAPHVSLAFQLALRFLYHEGVQSSADPDDPNLTRIGETTVPPFASDLGGYKGEDDGGYQFLLDWDRPSDWVPSITLSQVLDRSFDEALVRDHVVVLGTMSPSVKDNFQRPTGLLPDEESLIYGAQLHGQITDQLIRLGRGVATPVWSWPEWFERGWIAAWCIASALIGVRVLSPLSLALTAGGGLVLLLGGALLALGESSLWLPIVPTALGSLAALALVVAYVTQQERTERRDIMSLFGRYASPRLAESVWNERDLFMAGSHPVPRRITTTVLLSDLTGYTARSENSDPAEVMEWLGTYTNRMAELVDEHGGLVNDFLGDGLMASFGVPLPSTTDEEVRRDACNAVECALAMSDVLDELNREWERSGQPTARLRVGILTGPAVVGHIGAGAKMKYAVVGDTVNAAARLESFDKVSFELEPEPSTCRILIGQATADCIADAYVCKCLGEHAVKGKGSPITIYRVLERG